MSSVLKNPNLQTILVLRQANHLEVHRILHSVINLHKRTKEIPWLYDFCAGTLHTILKRFRSIKGPLWVTQLLLTPESESDCSQGLALTCSSYVLNHSIEYIPKLLFSSSSLLLLMIKKREKQDDNLPRTYMKQY